VENVTRLYDRNGGPGTVITERISGRGKPHFRNQKPGRVRLTDGERTTLAALGKRLREKALAEVMSVVKPETRLAWHRKLNARKFDASTYRQYPGQPRIDPAIEQVIVQFARESSVGHDHIVAALKNVGYTVSD